MSSGIRRSKTRYPFQGRFIARKAKMHSHVRSNNMPSRAHSLGLRILEELPKLKTCVASASALPSAKMACRALDGLAELYCSMEELLCLPGSQISQLQQKTQLEEELDASVKVLDLCGALKDQMAAAKEHAQNLQLVLRKNEGTNTASKARCCIQIPQQSKMLIKNCIRGLRRMDAKYACIANENDVNFQVMVMVLKEVREMTISLLQSITSFMFNQCSKQSRWSFVSKALQKRKIACEVEHEDISNREDLLLCSSKVCSQEQLAALEERIQEVETGLESLFQEIDPK